MTTKQEIELTDDEQFAKAIEGNALFDSHSEVEPPADDVQDEPAADPADDADAADPEPAEPAEPADEPAAEDEPFPGYNTLDEAARVAYDKVVADRAKAENNYKALHGIAAPLQKGNEELRRQLQAQVARIQQLEDLGRKQQTVSAATATATDEALQSFEQWAKDYPEESQAIQAMVNPLREKIGTLEAALGKVSTLEAQLGEIHAERQKSALQTELGVLATAHPDWEQVHQDPAYWGWLESQPPGIRSLNDSMYAGDAIELISMFKRSSAPATHEPAAAALPNAADAVRARRDAALKRGTQPIVRTSESSSRTGDTENMTDDDAMYASLTKGNPNFPQ